MEFTKEQREQLRREWVADLRSGKFKQTQGVLEDSNGNCCLGLACRVFDRIYPGVLTIEKRLGITSFDNATAMLPGTVKRAFGLATHGGMINELKSLAGQNDAGKSFAEIADVIESKPEGLFVD
jgi:hypothetical protein